MARKANGRLTRLANELGRMANAVFKSDEYRRFLSLPLTRERAAYYIFERSHFHLNRPFACFAIRLPPVAFRLSSWPPPRAKRYHDRRVGTTEPGDR